MPAVAADSDVDLDDVAVDRNAGAARRLDVAADRVGVAAELGPVQEEHRRCDDEGGHHHRIGQDAFHPAEQVAVTSGRVRK